MVDSRPVASSPHWAHTATTLKPPHRSRYPAVKADVAAKGDVLAAPFELDFRVTAACSNTIGAALGSIMASIINHHITSMMSP